MGFPTKINSKLSKMRKKKKIELPFLRAGFEWESLDQLSKVKHFSQHSDQMQFKRFHSIKPLLILVKRERKTQLKGK